MALGHNHKHFHKYSGRSTPNTNRPIAVPTVPKRGLLNKIKERFQEPPVTREEIEQLKLQAQREQYKTAKAKFKHDRPPSGLARFIVGDKRAVTSQRPTRGTVYRQRPQTDFSTGFETGSMLGEQPSYRGMDDLFGAGSHYTKPKKPRNQYQRPQSDGLNEMFGLG